MTSSLKTVLSKTFLTDFLQLFKLLKFGLGGLGSLGSLGGLRPKVKFGSKRSQPQQQRWPPYDHAASGW